MKRVLIAGLLAVGIHGFLLKLEFGWLKKYSFEKPIHRPLSINLAIKQPQVPAKEVVSQPPVAPEKQSLNKPLPLKKKTTPRVPKPDQQRYINPSAQPVEEKTASIPEAASESLQKLEPKKLRYPPQTSITEAVDVTESHAVIEARPLYRINPPPKYPAMARRRGYVGQVVLDVLVGQSGSVVDLRVSTSSGHDMLDKAAVDSVKTWIFEPGMKGDKTVEMWVRVPIRFELK